MPGPDADLAASPWDYPGTAATCSGVLEHGRFSARPVAELLEASAARTLVVAVGSNASPAVMHRKLSRHRVPGPVPLVAATLRGCAVGHSAHVSLPGFVAAAPFLHNEAATPVYVTLLDAEQLRCVDLSEPNYVRRRVPRGACALELEDGTRPATFDLYDGRWGVLGPPGEAVLPFGSQVALHALLRARWPAYRDLVGDARTGDDDDSAARPVMRLLAADAELRHRVREAFAATGWSRDSGLGRWPAASDPPADQRRGLRRR
jgi:hypothetical protein